MPDQDKGQGWVPNLARAAAFTLLLGATALLIQDTECTAARAVQPLRAAHSNVAPASAANANASSLASRALPEEVRQNGQILLAAARSSCESYSAMVRADLESSASPPSPATLPGVSVIVGTYQRFGTLQLLVQALRAQQLVQVEIIVVDAGSTPPASLVLPDLQADTYLYRAYDGLYHRVRSYNEGAALAKHDILVLLDDDVVPASEYWAYAAVSSLRDHPSSSIARLPMIIKEFQADLRDAQSRVEEVEGYAPVWPGSYFDFSTCNLVVKKTVWQQLGGFDRAYDGRYGDEDRDFHRRAGEAGIGYARGPPYGCALHVGVFYGNRGIKGGNN